MKTTLEKEDIQAIVSAILEVMKPILSSKKPEDRIFDKKALSEYLHLPVTWIDKNLHKLPHFKVGKYVRFKKNDIDKFIEQEKMKVMPPQRFYLLRNTR
jgi:hypothetical protein